MDLLLFSYLLVMAWLCFAAYFACKDYGKKLLFSLLSVILFALSALASFAIERFFVIGSAIETQIYTSSTFAGICMLFGTLSLILFFDSLKSMMKRQKAEDA